MAEFKEVLLNKARMCNTFDDCLACPLMAAGVCHLTRTVGRDIPDIDTFEQTVMKWAEEHPNLTNKEKFKEVFGMDITYGCVGFSCEGRICSECPHKNFWYKPYVEPTKEAE